MADRICSIEGCGKKEFARRWCHMHWNRWHRNGDPTLLRQLQRDDKARLAQYFIKGDVSECWPWLGEISANGYGRSSKRGRRGYAHRVVYEAFVGPIPDGLDIDHDCHNHDPDCPGGHECQHRRCVNYESHLMPRTRSENSRLGRYERVR